MTVYSFACSTPDDWSNWHLWAKTFGPGLIAAFIALMAFGVANTQKQIATNKYNLDMFDKRWSVFEDFYKEYKIYLQINILHDFSIGTKIDVMKKILLKAERFFEDITQEDFEIFRKNIMSLEYTIITSSQEEFKNSKLRIERNNKLKTLEKKYIDSIKNSLLDQKDKIKSEIDKINDLINTDNNINLYQDRKLSLDILMKHMQSIYDRMNNVLKVPHKPYVTILDKIIKKKEAKG